MSGCSAPLPRPILGPPPLLAVASLPPRSLSHLALSGDSLLFESRVDLLQQPQQQQGRKLKEKAETETDSGGGGLAKKRGGTAATRGGTSWRRTTTGCGGGRTTTATGATTTTTAAAPGRTKCHRPGAPQREKEDFFIYLISFSCECVLRCNHGGLPGQAQDGEVQRGQRGRGAQIRPLIHAGG